SIGEKPSVALRLAAMGCQVDEDVARLADRLRLANAERDLMLGAVAAMRHIPGPPAATAARRLLYALGADVFRGAVALAAARRGEPGVEETDAWIDTSRLPDRWPAPRSPLGGRDALAAGAGHGPAIGAVLNDLKAWWIEQDFQPDAATLRARLQ